MPESGSNNPSTVGPSGVAPYVRGSYAAAGSQLIIDKWNGDNDYEKCQWKMKAVLKRNRVHRVVFDTHLLPEDISDVEREKKWKSGHSLHFNLPWGRMLFPKLVVRRLLKVFGTSWRSCI